MRAILWAICRHLQQKYDNEHTSVIFSRANEDCVSHISITTSAHKGGVEYPWAILTLDATRALLKFELSTNQQIPYTGATRHGQLDLTNPDSITQLEEILDALFQPKPA